jgi:hypothetical protein
MPTEPTPSDLIAGLHRGETESQALLKNWCREPIARLVDRLRARQHLGDERALLIERTLHWTAMYLRSREPAEFAGMGRNGFVVSVLARAFKLLTPPGPEWQAVTRCLPGSRDPDPITSAPYEIRSHSRPLEWVGGDWSDLAIEGDAGLWAIAADVTGHGYPAYLVAVGLPHLWGMRSIADLRARGCAPDELLDALSDALAPVLPAEVLVEATLARFTPAGRAVLSGAGFCRLALRRSGEETIDLHHLGGLYLGLGPGRRDRLDWAIGGGDEVMMASDGLFEQPDSDSPRCQLEATLARRATAHLSAGRTLHDAILAVLEEALRGCPQRDDITVLTIRYQHEPPAARGTAYAPV